VRIIASIEDAVVIEKILAHLDEKALKPEVSMGPGVSAGLRKTRSLQRDVRANQGLCFRIAW
jgi:hypothetical protein